MTPEQKTLIEKEADKYTTFRDKLYFLQGARELDRLIANQWIKIEEGLPERNDRYLCKTYGYEYLEIYSFNAVYRMFTDDNSQTVDVTHWQPLPLPPAQ